MTGPGLKTVARPLRPLPERGGAGRGLRRARRRRGHALLSRRGAGAGQPDRAGHAAPRRRRLRPQPPGHARGGARAACRAEVVDAPTFLLRLQAEYASTSPRRTSQSHSLRLSAARRSRFPPRAAVFGEISLTGGLRSCSQSERRVAEAGRAGFDRIVVPAADARETGGRAAGATDLRGAFAALLQRGRGQVGLPGRHDRRVGGLIVFSRRQGRLSAPRRGQDHEDRAEGSARPAARLPHHPDPPQRHDRHGPRRERRPRRPAQGRSRPTSSTRSSRSCAATPRRCPRTGAVATSTTATSSRPATSSRSPRWSAISPSAHADKGLSTGEKQMFSKAKKILASELDVRARLRRGRGERVPGDRARGHPRGRTRSCRRLPRARSRRLIPAPVARQRRPRGVLQPAIRAVLALLGALAGYQLADRIRDVFVRADARPGRQDHLAGRLHAGRFRRRLPARRHPLAAHTPRPRPRRRGHGARQRRRGRRRHRRGGGRPLHRHAHQRRPRPHPHRRSLSHGADLPAGRLLHRLPRGQEAHRDPAPARRARRVRGHPGAHAGQAARHQRHHRRAHPGDHRHRLRRGRARSIPRFVLEELQRSPTPPTRRSACAAAAASTSSAPAEQLAARSTIDGTDYAGHRRPSTPSSCASPATSARRSSAPTTPQQGRRDPGRQACSTSTTSPTRSSRPCCRARSSKSSDPRGQGGTTRASATSTTAP